MFLSPVQHKYEYVPCKQKRQEEKLLKLASLNELNFGRKKLRPTRQITKIIFSDNFQFINPGKGVRGKSMKTRSKQSFYQYFLKS